MKERTRINACCLVVFLFFFLSGCMGPLMDRKIFVLESQEEATAKRCLESKNENGKGDFIIGSDSLNQFHTWREPEKLINECTVVVAGRPGFSIEQCQDKYAKLIKLINTPLLDISASTIRRRVRDGKSIRYLTPQAVIKFITDQKLYIV